jgi:DHA1 family bicyclomycin/chloramphenicol resistance-like MFS transporter
MSRAFLVLFTGLLLALNAFSNDITLPAFWSMERSFGVPIEEVQAIIPVFLFCSAFGQLFFGPASDAYGRKPVILVGVSLYITGAVIAVFAGSITTMLWGRALQGFGSACGAVIARAILRDVHSGTELARTMAFATSIISLGPIMAPMVGYGLVLLGDWQGIFVGMAFYGIMLAAMVVIRIDETNTSPDPTAIQPSRLLASFVRVFSNHQSRYFILLSGINTFAILTYVANAPRLYRGAFGIEGAAFTLLFAVTGSGIVIGQYLNALLIARLGVMAATRLASSSLAVVAVLIAVLTHTGTLSLISFAALMLIYNAAFLVVMSNSVSMIIDPHREIAGFASSVFGFASQLTGGVLVYLTFPIFKGSMGAWSLGILVITLTVTAAVWVYRPKADN